MGTQSPERTVRSRSGIGKSPASACYKPAAMDPGGQLHFGSCRLDVRNEQLRHGARVLPLTPKAWAMLRYLVEHGARLVTKDELLGAIWPDVTVGEAVLKTTMAEVRRALGDRPTAPQFIETVHRRGYRFIASVTADGAGEPPRPVRD